MDYALKLLRRPRLFLEAKGLGEDMLDRKWIAQVLGYATVAGVEWCVLSDGDQGTRQEESLDSVRPCVSEAAARAMMLFEFSQNLAEIWRGSNSAVQTEIIECVSLNRHVSDLKLELVKRKPFAFLAEKPF